jgi:hypothetical protein
MIRKADEKRKSESEIAFMKRIGCCTHKLNKYILEIGKSDQSQIYTRMQNTRKQHIKTKNKRILKQIMAYKLREKRCLGRPLKKSHETTTSNMA